MNESMEMSPVPPQVPRPPDDEVEENPAEEVKLKPGFYHLSNVEFFRDGAGTQPLTGYTEGTMTIFNNGSMSFDGFVGTDTEKRFPVRGWSPVKVEGNRVTLDHRGEKYLPDAVIVVDAEWFKNSPF